VLFSVTVLVCVFKLRRGGSEAMWLGIIMMIDLSCVLFGVVESDSNWGVVCVVCRGTGGSGICGVKIRTVLEVVPASLILRRMMCRPSCCKCDCRA